MKTLRIILSGIVQGVTFRQFVKDKADELNVRGFVRNLENGDVEIVAEGKDENVNEILEVCKKGPTFSEVKTASFEELKHQGFDEFKISKL